MNIIKVFSKYVANSVIKIASHFTTDYSVWSAEMNNNLDEILIDNDTNIKGLFAFLQPKKITLKGVSGWTIASTMECVVCGNTCYLNGAIGKTSGALQGEYNLDIFPNNIRPTFDMKKWYPIIIDGVAYNAHVEIRANGMLNLFFYDQVPAGNSIPINFTFQMTTDYIG